MRRRLRRAAKACAALAGAFAAIGCTAEVGEDARTATTAIAAETDAAALPADSRCTRPQDAELRVELAGAVERELHWRGIEMSCGGMARPDGQGLRVTFAGTSEGEELTFVFGVPQLGEGESGTAVPVNVTVIRGGGGVYGTRGEDRCTLDRVEQSILDEGSRVWRIEARGFCLAPARAVAGPDDAILLETFDFTGQLTWDYAPPD